MKILCAIIFLVSCAASKPLGHPDCKHDFRLFHVSVSQYYTYSLFICDRCGDDSIGVNNY